MKIKLIYKEKYNKTTNIISLILGLGFFYLMFRVIKDVENYLEWIAIGISGLMGFLFLWSSYKMFKERNKEKFDEKITCPDKIEVLENKEGKFPIEIKKE